MSGQNLMPRTRGSHAILAVLLGLSALSWGLVIWQSVAMNASAMSGSMGANTGLTMNMGIALFLTIWVAMMVAMMFPSAAPMILMFSAISAGKRQRSQPSAPLWIFVGGYLLVWTLAGLAAYALATGLDWLASQSMWLMDNASRLGGATLLVAGVYQLSPFKNVCLAKCRTPLQFIMTSWHDGAGGALRMGTEHGLYCLGCCWLLFVILFPLGMMNIAALAVVTALIFAEKVLPTGNLVSRLIGAALIIYGALVIFLPALLPAIRIGA